MKFLSCTVYSLWIGSTCIAGAHQTDKLTRTKTSTGIKTAQREQRHHQGVNEAEGDGRTLIVGGTPARVGEYPYFVDLIEGCGASLIAPGVVLSAAHCMPSGVSYLGKPVHVGAYDRGQVTNGAVRATVTKELPHPSYNVPVSGFAYDFLLLKLDSPVVASESVNFSLNSVSSTPADGEKLTVFGTGTIEENGSQSDVLLEVDLPTTSTARCNGPYNGEVKDEVMFCAGGKGDKDACQGDSGGPIIVKNGNTHTQVGVVSWGEGCARPGVPGVYARVSAAMNWIAYVTCTCWGVNDANICSNLNPNDNFSCESDGGGSGGGGGGDTSGGGGSGVGSSGCEVISGWTDELGDGCGWYEQNDIKGCPQFGYIEDPNGVSAWQACCHCEGGDPSAGSNQAGCELISGWVDSVGDGCGWYEANDSPTCPSHGYIGDTNGVTAWQACCHCEGGGFASDVQTGCELIAGWYDLSGDRCAWYESNDSPGCPNYGGLHSADDTTAWQACCHCKGGGSNPPGNPTDNSDPQTGCELVAGWVESAFGETCAWYESNEFTGCPDYGMLTSDSGVTAWEACCHCKGGGDGIVPTEAPRGSTSARPISSLQPTQRPMQSPTRNATPETVPSNDLPGDSGAGSNLVMSTVTRLLLIMLVVSFAA